MTVKFLLNDLCCANCAAKIEEKVSKVKGVESSSVNFLTAKMILDVDQSKNSNLFEDIEKAVRKIEPDIEIKKL